MYIHIIIFDENIFMNGIRCVSIDGKNRVRFLKPELTKNHEFMKSIDYMVQELETIKEDEISTKEMPLKNIVDKLEQSNKKISTDLVVEIIDEFEDKPKEKRPYNKSKK